MGANLKYFLAVNKIPGLGPVKIKKALEHFGGITSFWNAGRSKLYEVDGFSDKTIQAIVEARDAVDPDEELRASLESGYKILTLEDDDYPANLRNIYDPPPVLYVDGEMNKGDSKAIAIVGTRTPTYYGRETARQFSKELVGCGFTIISGLALGVDSEAHTGALDASGRTIAVYGSGIDQVYPQSNRRLAAKISKSGANVSEFPLGLTPDKWTFPQRNRIISGLSLGVIVIEGALDSGALITARLALEQGREVFAVPGSIRSGTSKGPHSIIKDGAKLVESIDDVLEELHIYVNKQDKGQKRAIEGLNGTEKKIMSLLSYEPMMIDNIIVNSGSAASELLSSLTMLEIKGYVKQLPGKNFVLV